MSRPDTALPREQDGAPVFAEPWEAQTFAMVVSLHDRGLFTWTEWSDALASAATAPGARGGYADWLTTVEGLVATKGVTGANALAHRRDAFDRAARATPHGEPILLANDPLGGG